MFKNSYRNNSMCLKRYILYIGFKFYSYVNIDFFFNIKLYNKSPHFIDICMGLRCCFHLLVSWSGNQRQHFLKNRGTFQRYAM